MKVLIRASVKPRVMAEEGLRRLSSLAVQEVRGSDFKHRAELSVVLTGDAEIKELNRLYRGKNQTTDVLSFSLLEGKKFPKGSTKTVAMGDVVVSVPQARRQALMNGNSFKRELSLLVVHGILHLLGYDHVTVFQERKMFALQDAILKKWES